MHFPALVVLVEILRLPSIMPLKKASFNVANDEKRNILPESIKTDSKDFFIKIPKHVLSILLKMSDMIDASFLCSTCQSLRREGRLDEGMRRRRKESSRIFRFKTAKAKKNNSKKLKNRKNQTPLTELVENDELKKVTKVNKRR
jgi:hypothetical protein